MSTYAEGYTRTWQRMGMQCTLIANIRPLLIGACPPVGDYKEAVRRSERDN